MPGKLHFFVFFLLIVLQQDVKAAWKYTRKSRRYSLKYQNDAASYGPNVCAIQEVFRTGERFYPDCIKKRLKKVCGRPTFVRYECCCGYDAVEGEEGCPSVQPLKNIYETLVDHGLKQFTRLLTNTELEHNLKEKGAYTVFVPVDEAFNSLTNDQKQRLYPWTYHALSLLHYHVVPGWHHSDHMKKMELLPTLYYGLKPVWIARPSNKDMHTANCARVIRSNILATNGVIHLIDQMMSPFDMFGNMTDVMFRDSGQFSQFVQVLYTSQLITMIREEGPFTVFAPNNYAFSRLPKLALEKMLRDVIVAEALVKHHVAKGTYCSTSNIDSSGVKMLDGSRMRFQCKKNGHYIHNSKLVKKDILAGNGIIHLINKIQMPNSIQTMEGLARELHLNKFLQLAFTAGLLDKMQTGKEMTLFIPTDEAFHAQKKQLKEDIFLENSDLFEDIFDYHSTIGKIKTDSFIGDTSIIMNTGDLMKISVHRDGILMDDAAIVKPNNECLNGVIHVIDKVLSPPMHTLYEIIEAMEDLSIFRKGLSYGEIYDMLKSEKEFSVFAPTDQAFNKLPSWHFDKIFDDPKVTKMYIQHHIVDRVIIGRTIAPNSLMKIKSMQGESFVFSRAEGETFALDKYSDVVEPMTIAKNGVLYKLDRLLDCDCKKDPS